MVKHKSWMKILSGGLLVGLFTGIIVNSPALQAQTQGRVQFICNESSYEGERYPTTFAWNPKNKKALIRWETEDFTGNGFPPEKRCQEVSPRFQEAYEDGSFKYMTHGTMKNQPVICTSSELGGECDRLLITLRHEDNAEKTLAHLSNVLLGDASNPVVHSSGEVHEVNGKIYVEVDIEDFLNK